MFIEDAIGICAHIIHKNNTSRCFPNHIIAKALENKYFNSKALQHEEGDENTEEKNQIIANRQKLRVYPAPEAWEENAPTVSVCTLTFNRNYFLPLLQSCIEKQDYPHSKIEWLVLNDSTREFEDPHLETSTGITIKYQRLNQKLPLGRKRNLSHQLCSGDYIIYMDDDDYYYPTRVRHAVSSLIHSRKAIAGSTLMQIYYCHDQQLWLSGPFGQNHATANTFAMTREFARSKHYKDEDICNEEKFFLNNYTIPMQQLNPTQTNICISHLKNTFDKRKMRRSGKNPKMRQLQNMNRKIKSILNAYQEAYEKFQS